MSMSPETRAKIHAIPEAPIYSRVPSVYEPSRALGILPAHRTYGVDVPADPSARLAAFAAFVRRATERAKIGRGLSIEQVAELADISANTIYLWRSGKGTKFPLGASVEAFCDALGIKPEVAFQILWPGSDARPSEPMPLGPDGDLLILARRLADPATSERERFLIRETIRGLAARSSSSAEGPEDAPKRRSAS